MRIHRLSGPAPADLRGAAVAIGNFDGVHHGHRMLINRAQQAATAIGAPSGVLTFEPHPREFFARHAPPFRLTNFRAKAASLCKTGIDLMAVSSFGSRLAMMSAQDFVGEMLVRRLGVGHVVVGYDFAFGHKRAGNVDYLRAAAAEHGFGLTVIDPVREGEEVVSSTRIRDALWQGDPRRAAGLLGHWWEVHGRVRKGDQRGRTIGFPTANIALGGYLEPQFGVYAVRIGWPENGEIVWRDGVANLGRRPTFNKNDVLLEVNVFDFQGNIYGKRAQVRFIDFIRPERKFDGLELAEGADRGRRRKGAGDPDGNRGGDAMSEKIGFIGLGAMGGPMAANLIRKGHDLVVHDIDPAKTAEIAGLGAEAADSIADVARKADIVLTMLPDSPDVDAAVLGPGGVLENGRPDQLVMDMSTIAPATTDKLHRTLTEAGIGFVDAPVGRLVTHAIAGELLFMVGATGNDFGRVKPLIEGMGTTIHHCGAPGTGIRTKLVNNLVAISVCQIDAEAITLAQSWGLDVQKTIDVINGTTATNGHLITNWPNKVLKGDTSPGFRVALAHKDVSLALQAAHEAGIPMFVGAAVREAYAAARAAGYSDQDFSAMVDALCKQVGVKPPRL
ncbi:MAG: bifunctional riboflavin kinase/FAD synthetase [Minwuia sp.]|uniref:bifunctional riboflavin kinase/FAD synthetase n=1 Tax=Minwuia sp. TaxID=2493630 RepID=UPI003A8598E1